MAARMKDTPTLVALNNELNSFVHLATSLDSLNSKAHHKVPSEAPRIQEPVLAPTLLAQSPKHISLLSLSVKGKPRDGSKSIAGHGFQRKRGVQQGLSPAAVISDDGDRKAGQL
jgi:hypothetical protein